MPKPRNDREYLVGRALNDYETACKNFALAKEAVQNWTAESDTIAYRYTKQCCDSIFTGIENALKLFLSDKNIHAENEKVFAELCNKILNFDEFESVEFSCFTADKKARNLISHQSWVVELHGYYRILDNLSRILSIICPEKQIGKTSIPLENAFDFTLFYDLMDRFEGDHCRYVLLCDPMHDISADDIALLMRVPWNLVIDFDGRTERGGLRSKFPNNTNAVWYKLQNIRVSGIDEAVFRSGKIVHVQVEDGTVIPSLKRDWRHNEKNNFDYLVKRSITVDFPQVKIVCMKSFSPELENVIDCFCDQYGNGNVEILLLMNNDLDTSRLQRLYQHYYAISGETCDIFGGLREYRHVLPVSFSHDVEKGVLLPGRDGQFILQDKNLIDNTEVYFEILDLYCGRDVGKCNEEDFLKGEMASWEVLNCNYDILPINEFEYKDICNNIRKCVNTKEPGSRIFNIVHKPGFGGTTLGRRIAWDLHYEYPVLILKKYDSAITPVRIKNFYDTCKTGVFILADENSISQNEMTRLENDIKNIDRPVVALIVNRDNKGVGELVRAEKHRKIKNSIQLSLLCNEAVDKIKLKCKTLALKKYSREDVEAREREMSNVLKGDMLCPLLISLYYLEEDFTRLDEYVHKFISVIPNDTDGNNLKQALIFISFCDYFSSQKMLKAMVEWILNPMGLQKLRLTDVLQPVNDLLLFSNQQVHRIRTRHYLISKEIMHQLLIPEEMENTELDIWEDYLKRYCIEFINLVRSMCKVKIDLDLIDMITDVFIDNRSLNQGNYNDLDGEFSLLIETIPLDVERVAVLSYLAETFNEFIESNIDPADGYKEYKMVAHIWGHLARLYSKKGLRNHEEAEKCCQKAIQVTEIIQSYDYVIYHIYGDCLYRNAKVTFEAFEKAEELVTVKELINLAAEYFRKSSDYGNAEYGITSLLRMFTDFLEVVFKMYNVNSIADIKIINEKWILIYISNVSDILQNTSLDNFSEKARSIYQHRKLKFESLCFSKNISEILMELNNYLDVLISKPVKDSENVYQTRKAIISTVLKKHDGDFISLSKNKKDTERILELLNANIDMGHKNSFYDYTLWFKIAKCCDVSVSDGIVMARKWNKQFQHIGRVDPMPFYYLYVLHLLLYCDGHTDAFRQSDNYRQDCLRACEYSKRSGLFVSVTKVRDWFGIGKGIGRLVDDSFIKMLDIPDNEKVATVQGVFSEIDPTGRGSAGRIDITEPSALKKVHAFFVPLECGLSNLQLNRTLSFKFGFSFERLTAFNNSVVDMQAAEKAKIVQVANSIVPQTKITPSLKKDWVGETVDFEVINFVNRGRFKLLAGKIAQTEEPGGIIISEVSFDWVSEAQMKEFEGKRVKAKVIEFDHKSKKYRLSIKQIISDQAKIN